MHTDKNGWQSSRTPGSIKCYWKNKKKKYKPAKKLHNSQIITVFGYILHTVLEAR
jgi:hypothetical protein